MVDSWFVKNEYGNILVDDDQKTINVIYALNIVFWSLKHLYLYVFFLIIPFLFVLWSHMLS
jgi:hypothetical protein